MDHLTTGPRTTDQGRGATDCGPRTTDHGTPGYESTIALVREYSEHATLRPSPRKLRCIPWRPFELQHVNATIRRIQDKIEVAVLLAKLGEEFRHSALRVPNSAL